VALGRVGRVVARGLRLRCPRCGGGRVFDGPFRMRARCAACGLTYEREAGYFVGAIYLNYGLTVTTALLGYFLLDAWPGLTLGQQLGLWGGFVVLFPFWSFRYSKALWLSLDHLVDPQDKRE
jgi:uncharacterized protein (DUF983 family)